MSIQITITNAGRAEIINAANIGTAPVTITHVGVGTGQYVPAATQTTLQAETKRLATIAGQVVADDTIHITIKDESNDAYNVSEFGLFTDSGTLFAVYSQNTGPFMQKAGPSTLLLSVDILLGTLDANNIAFGETGFSNPPASETVAGVVELATPAETATGTDTARAVTPAGLKPLLDVRQPLDATLTALAALATVADRLIYATGPDTFATTALSAFIRTLLDDTDAAAARTTLGAAPLASPGLTGTPTAPTPAQFDDDTSLATTAFVQRAMGGFGRLFSYGTSGQTIPASQANSHINIYGTCSSITLPLANTVPPGSVLMFDGVSLTCTIHRQGTNSIFLNGVNNAATSVIVNDGSSVMFTSDGAGSWFATGIATLKYASEFFASLGPSGYQKFPSGLIIQWGASTQLLGQAQVTFPLAFPSAAFQIIGIHDGGAGAMVISQGGTLSKTGCVLRIYNDAGTQSDNWAVRWFALGF